MNSCQRISLFLYLLRCRYTKINNIGDQMKLKFLLVFGVALFTLLMLGCLNEPTTAPTATSTSNGLVGVWESQFAKTGTMCVTDQYAHCLRTIPWLRKDINHIHLNADSTATNDYQYVRVNDKDSSESWKRVDSMSYSISNDSIRFQFKKFKYQRDTVWATSSQKLSYKLTLTQDGFTLDNYKMWDTGFFYLTNLNFVKVQ